MHTKDQIIKRLSEGSLKENEYIELKEQWAQENGKVFSAIGNANKKGWVLVGVNDKGEILQNSDKDLNRQKSHIENHIDQYLDPSATVQSISIESIEQKKFLLIEVINPNSVVSWNDKFYKKIGATSTEMSPSEKQQLELDRPGFDYSGMEYKGIIDSSLVLDFAQFLNTDKGWSSLSADDVLSRLNIGGKNVSGILFGDFSYRVIRYNKESEILDQDEKKSLYSILKKEFIQNIQSWTRTDSVKMTQGLSVTEEKPYSDKALREVLVNAVSHALFSKRQGGVKIELYPNRIKVSNNCSLEAEAFINKRFSTKSFAYNPLLMKILRKASFSEELGSGKEKIFKYMIEDGKREPLFEYNEQPENFGVWSVTLYNEKLDRTLLGLLKRIKTIYDEDLDERKIATALLLWRDKTLLSILDHMDLHYQKLAIKILRDDNSPFLLKPIKKSKYSEIQDYQIELKRWGKINLIGQESRMFNKSEEDQAKEVLKNYAYKEGRGGFITNKEARHILGLSNSKSEQVQISRLFQKWEKENFMKKTQTKGSWKVKYQNKSDRSSLSKEEFTILLETIKKLSNK